MIVALLSVLLVASEAPAAAETPAPADQTAAAEPAKKPEKVRKICRVDPAYTGSRMPKKLCLSQAEWDNRDAGRSAGDLRTLGAH